MLGCTLVGGMGNEDVFSQGNIPRQGTPRSFRTLNVQKARHRLSFMQNLCEAGEDEGTLLQCETDADRGIQPKVHRPLPYHDAAEVSERRASPYPENPLSTRRSPLPKVVAHAPSARPWLLVPKITVTSDSTCLYQGQQHIWAAVEVTGQLCQAYTGISSIYSQQIQNFSFEYGCLHHLTVDVIPTTETSVAQIIEHQAFPASIHLGSGILLLVQLNLNHGGLLSPRRSARTRQRSEELIEDLENQLGDAPVGYMEINLSYSHPAFTHYMGQDATTGISSARSRMQTTAVATLKRHNALSPWSQRPASVPDRLFHIIERHWGVERASEAMQKILSPYTTPRKTITTSPRPPVGKSDLSGMQFIAGQSPRVPIRQASLATEAASRVPTPAKGHGADIQRVSSGPAPTWKPIHGNASVSDVGSGIRKTSRRLSSRASKHGEEKGGSLWKRWSFYLP